jgi:hypothetical protein
MKIKELLVKAGCSPELVNSIVESLEQYKVNIREGYEQDFKARVEQAKKVCIEETEAHKRELAKRLQIFCETKAAGIEAQIAKQSALNESKAVSKLTQLANVLSGYANGTDNGQVTATINKAQRKIQQVNEEKLRALEVANRQTAIAEKALSENRRLAAEVKKLKNHLEESKPPRASAKRIEENRTVRPRTTRPTLVESQDRRAVPKRPTVMNRPVGIADIANSIDTDLV